MLAIAAGLLLAFSFPGTGIAGFAWIAPGLILAVAANTRGWKSFRIGYVAGFAHYLASLYWLLLIPYRWHGLPLGPAMGWIALSAYLALFPAAWVWLVNSLAGYQPDAIAIQTNVLAIADWKWRRRAAWAFFCGVSWAAMEMGLARFLGGFPWNLLGASQYRILPLIQVASVTGVFGVSFVVVWTSASLLCAAMVLIRRPNTRSVFAGEMILPMLAVAVTFAFGMHRIGALPQPTRSLRVTAVQPAVPQTLIWDPSADMDRFRELLKLSEAAVTNETDLLIWPEAALPRMLRYDPEIREPVLEFAQRHHVWMIVGSDDAEPADNDRRADYFNSSFLINPEGEIAARYTKRNLVIFGEFVPMTKWLPFLKWFTPVDQGFTPGKVPVTFEMNFQRESPESGAVAGRVATSVLICFEDTFPLLAREAAVSNLDFLVNITNDGWFGEAAAQWQQAANACFRAVENNVPLVRCANTGLTCWIDPAGRIRDVFLDANGGIYGPGFATFEIPLNEDRAETFYHRHGDWFGWVCVGLTVAMLVRRGFVK